MRRRIIRWVIVAVAVPIVASVLLKAGERVEQSRGPDSKAAKGLKFASGAANYVR
jgi:hypothetical protein